MEHTFVFDMKTTTGFHLWYSTIRYNHRIMSIELIYLRYTVVLICGVYEYTTVDINTPYKRFKSILWWFFVAIYVLFSTDFFICIYLYVYVHDILHIYIYVLPPIFICIYVHILIHMCVFSSHYILTARVFARQPAERCKGRTFVHFNIFKIFHLIEHFR